MSTQPVKINKRTRFIAVMLALFLGGLGIQWFYLGRYVKGLLCVLFSWTAIPFIISFFHFIILCFISDEEFDRKYNS